MLAKLLTNMGNVVILDEPTNDLDMDTLDMLQEILADYTGTLIIVSHDRDFLDRTVTEVLAFEGDGVVEHCLGGYSDYHTSKKAAVATAKKPVAVVNPAPTVKAAEAPKRPPKLSGKQRHELDKLPEKIALLEAEIMALRTQLLDAELYTRDASLFDASSTRFIAAEAELDALELRWLELEERRVANE
jgi:ATP-binding cassette subfamily F protein uup